MSQPLFLPQRNRSYSMELFVNESCATATKFHLGEEDARHLTKVHRARSGDEVFVTDGLGTLAKCIMLPAPKGEAYLEVVDRSFSEPSSKSIKLFVSPLKSEDRFEWLIEKATEIGVSAIQPIQTARTEAPKFREERYRKIMLAACKQSLRTWFPSFSAPINFQDLQPSDFMDSAIAFCEDVYPSTSIVSQPYSSVFIGPEGDFTLEEVDFAKSNGAEIITLGERRLRTETAAIVALTKILI